MQQKQLKMQIRQIDIQIQSLLGQGRRPPWEDIGPGGEPPMPILPRPPIPIGPPSIGPGTPIPQPPRPPPPRIIDPPWGG